MYRPHYHMKININIFKKLRSIIWNSHVDQYHRARILMEERLALHDIEEEKPISLIFYVDIQVQWREETGNFFYPSTRKEQFLSVHFSRPSSALRRKRLKIHFSFVLLQKNPILCFCLLSSYIAQYASTPCFKAYTKNKDLARKC